SARRNPPASLTASWTAYTKSCVPPTETCVRYAVLSDVHGNLEALSAVLADSAREGATGLICLGDAVGYGADPNACVELLGERVTRMVAGNHEHGALGLIDLDWFNPVARTAALWTREQRGPAARPGSPGRLRALGRGRAQRDAPARRIRPSRGSPQDPRRLAPARARRSPRQWGLGRAGRGQTLAGGSVSSSRGRREPWPFPRTTGRSS